MLYRRQYRGGILSDLVHKLSIEVGLDLVAVLTNVVLVVDNGEDEGDNLSQDSEYSISSYYYRGLVTIEQSISLIITKLKYTMIS